jgi:hypothetical protein
VLDKNFFARCGEVQIRNPKWFDRLTTLSRVEGQYPMIQIQMTKTVGRWVSVLNIGEFLF